MPWTSVRRRVSVFVASVTVSLVVPLALVAPATAAPAVHWLRVNLASQPSQSVDVYGWEYGTSVTVEADYTNDGSIDLSLTETMIGSSTRISLGGANPLGSGSRVTASGAGVTKELIVPEVRVEFTQASTDVVAGHAPAGAPVEVSVASEGTGEPFPTLATVADGSGRWSVDFTGTHDVVLSTDRAWAAVVDGDGDRTLHEAQVADPQLGAPVHRGMAPYAGISGWPAGTPVTVTFDATGDGTPEATVVATSAYFPQNVFFDDAVPEALPGARFTATGRSGGLKVLTLVDLHIDLAQISTDEVKGIAPAGAAVAVTVHPVVPGPEPILHVVANGSGRWAADFTGTHDLVAGDAAEVSITDADGDATHNDAQAAEPALSAPVYRGSAPYAGIIGWPEGTPVTVTYDVTGDGTPEATVTQAAQGGAVNVSFDDALPEALPGARFTATGRSGGTKVLDLVALHEDLVRISTDEVKGVAPVGATVRVEISTGAPGPQASLSTTAGGDGHWAVDFTGTHDVVEGDSAGASVTDGDGDATTNWAGAADPTISADVYRGMAPYVGISGWPAGTPVTVTYDVSGDGTPEATVTQAAQGGGTNVFFDEALPEALPGARFTATGRSGGTKVLTLADLHVDLVDPGTDEVKGAAPAGSSVAVELSTGSPGPQPRLVTTANGSGRWAVDFTATHDLAEGEAARASIADPDGDATTNGAGAAAPRLTAEVYRDASPYVTVIGWPDGTPVTVTYDATGDGTPEATVTQPAVAFGSNVFFGDSVPKALPGARFTATGRSGGTKVLTLAAVHVDLALPSTDEVKGLAPAGATVVVSASTGAPGPQPSLSTTADGSGRWAVDLTGTADLVEGRGVSASVVDADGDTTNHNAEAATPTVSGTVGAGPFASIAGWPAGTPVTVTYDANADGTPEGTVVATSAFNPLNVFFAEGLAPFAPGARITATGRSGGTKVLDLVDLHIDVALPASDEVKGIAPAGSSVVVTASTGVPGPQPAVTTTADGSGKWAVDLTGTVDVVDGTSIWASTPDGDGDATQHTAQAARPWIRTYLGTSAVSMVGWPTGTPVTVKIDATDDGTFDWQTTVASVSFGTVVNPPWPVAAGARIVATGRAGDAKTLVTVALTVTGVDQAADLVTGTAPAGTSVMVKPEGADPQPEAVAVANGSGVWVADLGAVGVDIGPDTGINATVADPDGDVTARAAASAVPIAPTGLTVSGTSATSVSLSWVPPSAAPGSPLTSHRVRVFAGTSATPVATIDTGSVVGAATVTGLTAGTVYRFQVAAQNAAGIGAFTGSSAWVIPPFRTVDLFTDRQYRDFAGRAPTSAELLDWRTRLTAGTSTPAARIDVAVDFSYWAKQSPVIRLFRAYFLRLPDTAGLNYWVGKYRGGMTIDRISSYFAGSSEFTTRYGSLTNRQFVELVYLNVLGRPGDAGGIAFWTSQLDLHKKTRGQVMVGFSESNEYKTKSKAQVDVVNLYTGMLRRVPTASENTTWEPQLRTGTPRTALITTLLGSAAYDARIPS